MERILNLLSMMFHLEFSMLKTELKFYDSTTVTFLLRIS